MLILGIPRQTPPLLAHLLWLQQGSINNNLQTLFALLSDLHHGSELFPQRQRNSKCARMQADALPPSISRLSLLHVTVCCIFSHSRWLVNGCINDQSVAAENFCKSPYTGCVIRRVTLPVRAHLKPGCQCSISNMTMLCSSPVRCGRLKIAPESIQVLERYCRYWTSRVT
jgi:hypothetical protein